MLKWILHGNRPYWWAPMNMQHRLDQYPTTCETGPGNPSGHCWLIAATITFLLVQFWLEIFVTVGEIVIRRKFRSFNLVPPLKNYLQNKLKKIRS
jgi:hypothetical protein